MCIKRLKTLTWVLIVFIFMITIKFFVLGVVRGGEFEEAARRQRIAGTSIEKDRGIIFDKNMIPITNRSVKLLACLIPDRLKDKKDVVRDVADICGENQAKLLAAVEPGSLPVFIEVDETRKSLIQERYGDVVPFIFTTGRYDATSVASHVTGYINQSDEIGQAGIEKFFEDEISSNVRKSVISVSDAKNQPLKGFGYVLTNSGNAGKKPLNIKLTLDYRIQKICEDALKVKNISGAVVVEDIRNGDIVAMASYPDYDRNNVENYLTSDKHELMNRATSSYNIGSVFKIVLAAKAIEMGPQYNYSYFCTGSYDVSGLQFLCHSYRSGGHGIVDMQTAFAQSCNSYFIDLGLELGMKNILDMAQRLGFGTATGINRQGISESSGNLPRMEFVSSGDIANTSIGQGEVLASPMQVANLITTIANGGVAMSPNIIEGLCDENGKTVEFLKKESRARVLKVSTAEELQKMMSEVVISGTAQGLQRYYLDGGAAGKTGSAETGIYDEDGKQIVHSWFGGYFPENSPKYTVSVFIENGVSLSVPATEVFGEIAREIIKNKL